MKWLFAVLAAGVAFAQSSLRIEKVATVEGITEYRLPNGLRVVMFPDPSKATMTVNMTYLVGSRHENYGETGMAHMIEHLMSFGSPRHPDAKKEQNDRGARRNASTSDDRTNYFEIFPASDANLEWALDLEADRMVNAYVKKDILASQMSVVRNELEMGENSPQRVLDERVMSTAFLWHNYGKSTIGSKSDIENVPIERLQAFYKKYYRPDNAVLVVAGQFDEQKALALVSKYLGAVSRPAEPVPVTYTVEPIQDGEREVTLRRVGDVQSMMLAYHVPAAAHPDTTALTVLGRILTDSPSGRLYKALVETKKAASVGSYVARTREPGAMMISASVRKESPLVDARSAILSTLDELSKRPVTKDEVDRARTQLLKQIDLSLTNSEQLGLALTEWIAAGDWRLMFLNRDRIRETKPEDVQRVAMQYLKASNRTVGVFIPEDKPDRTDIPATPDLIALLKDYKGDQNLAQGEAFDPSPANIEKRTVRADLPNGMKLLMIPKKTRGGIVTAVLRLYFGDENSLKGRAGAAEAARGMLLRGTSKHTRQQLQDEFDRLKARVAVNGSNTYTDVFVETVGAKLGEVMKLVAEALQDSIFPSNEFEETRQSRLSQAESQKREPSIMAQIALAQHLTPYPEGDIRHVQSMEERIASIQKTSLDDAKKFYKDFYGASNAILAISGEVEPKQMQQLAGGLFGGWKSPAPYADVRRKFAVVEAVNEKLEAPDKANAFFNAGMLLNIGDQDKDFPALVLANYMLGGHSTSRLYSRIRGKEGLSYSVGSMLMADMKDPRTTWTAMAISNPQNVPKVEAAFREEMQKALKDGFTSEEVSAAKTGWLQSRNVQRSQDAALAPRLIALEHEGRHIMFDGELEQKVAALTPEEINPALRRHLDMGKISYYEAGDFAGKK
jgi:zinc protease